MSFVEFVKQQKQQQETAKPDVPPQASSNGHKAGGYAKAALQRELETLRATPEGSRNDQLNTSAFSLGQLVAGGELDAATVTTELAAVAHEIGLTEKEIERTLKSGIGSGRKEPRTTPPPRVDPVTTLNWKPPKVEGEEGFWSSRLELDHIRMFARARRASPWATLGVVLARVIVSTPSFVVLPPLVGGVASLNLFAGVVGHPGAGKGAAEMAGADAVKVYEDEFDVWKLGSGQGLAHGYVHRDRQGLVRHAESVLFSMAEVDHMTGLTGQQGSTLLPEVRSAWMGERLGHLYVDPAKRVPVEPHTYRAGLIVGIQPGRAGVLLDDSEGGTPQRFVWVPATDPEAPREPPAEPHPLTWQRPRWPVATAAGKVKLPVCEQACAAVDEARVARLRGEGDALDGHALFTRLKVAAGLGLLHGHAAVEDDDWRLAGTIMAISDATRHSVIEVLKSKTAEANQARAEAEATRAVVVADRVEDEAIKRVARRVTSALKDGQSRAPSEVRRKIAARDRQYVDVAIERLIDSGQVTTEEADRGIRYRLLEGQK